MLTKPQTSNEVCDVFYCSAASDFHLPIISKLRSHFYIKSSVYVNDLPSNALAQAVKPYPMLVKEK